VESRVCSLPPFANRVTTERQHRLMRLALLPPLGPDRCTGKKGGAKEKVGGGGVVVKFHTASR